MFTKFIVGWIALLVPQLMLAQSHILVCDSTVASVDRNMVDYTVDVRSLRGRVIDSAGVKMPEACLALFNSDHTALVGTTETNKRGEFAFPKIHSGDYWLVVRDQQNAFCPASARVQLRKVARKSKLVVHMEPGGIDSCSLCEAQ